MKYLIITLFSVVSILGANLCAQIDITDSHGKYTFDSPPKRFVVLNWALAEQLLELGESPVGIAGLTEFETLSTRYSLPEGTVNVGSRLNPNLSTIRDLKPEVIFIGYSQRSLIRPLSNIATVIYFKNFGKRYNNAAKSEERFLELAKLFQKTGLAQEVLEFRNQALEKLKATLVDKQTADVVTNVLLIAPSGQGNTRFGVFGKNSLPYHAGLMIGLNVLSPEETDNFGVAQLSKKGLLEQAASLSNEDVCLVVFEKYGVGNTTEMIDDLDKRHDCVLSIDYQQAFGGVNSLLWLAQEYAQSLIDNSSTP
ncbi:iron-siderophore ABC transporter substrate-binding protein [Arenicella sp. 4NH20-0111]|uniref:ABC transporter substrate-binding protein n=1 Tax=Arenicella sp. 4NH20-0111 TaxID=3127648 RepID=UPI00310C6B3D